MVELVIRQIAVRVNDGDTPPRLDVLQDQVAEQGCLLPEKRFEQCSKDTTIWELGQN